MALEISDYNGTIIPAGGDYPFGNIKDNPSGTIIDVASNGDLQQYVQKMMFEGGVTPNNLPDNATNGWQVFGGLQGVINRFNAQIIINLLGADYSTSAVYVLYGAEVVANDGIVFYNGTVYFLNGNSGPACGGGLVFTVAASTTFQMVGGINQLNVVCATSGTNIIDWADMTYFSAWKETGLVGTDFGSGAGGSYVVDNADIEYAKYLLRGKTIHLQIRLRGITVVSSPSFLTVNMPFLPSDISNDGGYLNNGVYTDVAGNPQVIFIQGNVGSPNSLKCIVTPVAGTDDQNVDISVFFEID